MGIRLVCSDLDGTLLQYGKKELEGEIFDQIRALHDQGILFCPASGRQYTSLRKLFAPVADCCIFLCENGGVIYKDEQCIAKNPMPRALAEEIAEDLWNRSDGQGEIMLSGQNTAYLMERGLGMLDRIKFIGNNYQVIQDPSEIPEDIVKVSVYLHEGVAAYADRSSPAGSRRTVQWPDLTGSIPPLPTKASVSPLSAGSLVLTLQMSWHSVTIITTYPCWISWDILILWMVQRRPFGKNTRITRRARKTFCGKF